MNKNYPTNVIDAIFGEPAEGYVYEFDKVEVMKTIDEVLSDGFNEAQRAVFYGLLRDAQTKAALARSLGISAYMVNKEFVLTLRKLRHPSRSKYFKKFSEIGKAPPDVSMTKEEQGESKMVKEKIFDVLNGAMKKSAYSKRLMLKQESNVAFFVNSDNVSTVEINLQLWAKENDVNLFVIEPDGGSINANTSVISKFGGPIIAPKHFQIDEMIKPKTVLFFKNLHLFQEDYRYWLLRIVNREQAAHVVADDREDKGYKVLENLLFSVATYDKSAAENGDFYATFTADAKGSFVYRINI